MEWRYDEKLAPGVDHMDPAVVAEYDRKHNKLVNGVETARAILAELSLPPNSTIADVGAGTGTFAIEAAKAGHKVYAVDVSRSMLTFAAQKAKEAGVEGITFVEAGFLSFESPEPLDAVATKAALHHLPDFWKAIAIQKIHAALKPGGRFLLADAIYSFDPLEYQEVFRREMEQFANRVDADFLENIRTDLCREFMTFGWIIEGILTRAGFRIDSTRISGPMIAAYVATKA